MAILPHGSCRLIRILIVLLVAGWTPPVLAGGSLETFGDIGQFAIPAVAAAIAVAKEDGDGMRQLAVSTALSFGTVEGLKRTVDKERPNGGDRSFPSGHTARAFSGASYLHYRYGWQWGFPAYVAAGLVAYGRVNADEHDWVDVAAGAAISNMFAFLLVDAIDDDVVIVPIVGGRKNRFGILASVRF